MRSYIPGIIISVGAHLLLAAAMVWGLDLVPQEKKIKTPNFIRAELIAIEQIQAPEPASPEKIKEAPKPAPPKKVDLTKQQLEKERLAQIAEEKKEKQQLEEEKRQAQLEKEKQQQAEAARQKKLAEEQAKALEAKRLAEEAKLKEQAKQREEELARQRAEAEKEAQRLEQERLEQERLERERERQEQERLEQERIAQEQLKAQQRQELRQELERERAARQAAEERQRLAQQAAEDEVLMQSYSALIQQRVTQAWSRPASARNGMEAEIRIQLIPTGDILDAQIIRSSGNAEFDRSAQRAVLRAESFPEIQQMPSRLFEKEFRQFRLTFRPEDLRQ